MARLEFGGCDAVELAGRFGTPLYVLSEDRIRDRIRELRETFLDRYENTYAAYASKALQTLDICRIMDSEGLFLDVVSAGELYAASRAGFPMERVLFHGSSKTPEEIRMAVEYGAGRVVVDNTVELEALNREARLRGRRVPILLRVAPGVQAGTHPHISTGQADSKFGIPLDPSVRDEYVGRALRGEGLELLGFHFHVGSQIFSNESHRAAVSAVLGFLREVRDQYGFLARELNLGGGFAVRYTGEDDPQPLAYYTDELMAEISAACRESGVQRPRVGIEPGRWIVGEAGITLYTVCSVKEIPGVRTYVGVDGGMPDNIRPALYGARYEATVADRHDAPRNRRVTVAGKCCESGDILIRDIDLQDPRPGDVLAVFTTGAYTHSMAGNYNRLPRPAMVLLRDGEARLSVRRETYEDLLSREILG